MAKLLNVSEAAELLGWSRWTLYRKVEAGEIRYVRLGPQSIRFREEDLNRLIEDSTIEPELAAAR